MQATEKITININATPQNPESRWVAVGVEGKLISEGLTPKDAIEAASKITNNFSVLFVPQAGNTYIF